ncbi:MAG: PD-(D/E)XK motif protein [Solirubrobacterales bacterium]
MTDRMSWEYVRTSIEDTTVPIALALDGAPAMFIFFDPGTGRLGLRMPAGLGELPASLLARVQVTRRTIDGQEVLEVSSTSTALRPYLHAFMLAVADRVQLEDWDPAGAVTESLDRFEALLQHIPTLSAEAELGLLGELWMLDRLLDAYDGTTAVDAWTGPLQQAHDARLGDQEIEVKATRSERRSHMISSMTQLVPSDGCSLHLLSLQFTAAGASAGVSLRDQIRRIQARLGPSAARRKLDHLLESTHGLDDDEIDRYRTPYKLRSIPTLIAVDDAFPRLVPTMFEGLIDASRVSDFRYRVNVEGLGNEDGSEPFLQVLPKEPSGGTP